MSHRLLTEKGAFDQEQEGQMRPRLSGTRAKGIPGEEASASKEAEAGI